MNYTGTRRATLLHDTPSSQLPTHPTHPTAPAHTPAHTPHTRPRPRPHPRLPASPLTCGCSAKVSGSEPRCLANTAISANS